MADQKIRVLGIAPYEGMRAAMQKEAALYPQLQVDLFTGDLAEGAAIVQRIQDEGYDVILSRGGTAEKIREITELPVIPIQISVYDLLRAMKLAENYNSNYAIMGFASVTKAAHTLCDVMQIKTDIITVSEQSEAETALQLLKNSGCRTVVCDMLTHTCARNLGMDAFLISSGVESIRNAYEQAIADYSGFSRMRRENIYLQVLAEEGECEAIVLWNSGETAFSSKTDPSEALLSSFRAELPRIKPGHPHRFFINHNTDLYQVKAERLSAQGDIGTIFIYNAYQIPSFTKNSGFLTRSREECQHLFQRSIFSISGSLGSLEPKLRQIAATQKPVMIIGEFGTGKEQIARAIYLYGSKNEMPMLTIDCALVNEKGWNFLFSGESSPLLSRGATIYMKRLGSMPEKQLSQLLSVLIETNVSRRIRLIFSCDNSKETPLPECAKAIIERASCMLLTMPSLRERSDEIPALTSLYLASLNLELGKQLIGPDPQATQLLQHYDWPGNYVQFQNLLYELAVITDGSYLRSVDVTQLLSRDRSLRLTAQPSDAQTSGSRTLEQITLDAVERALIRHNGNQSQAAKELGISRSTLWRYLKQIEETRLNI